MAVQNRKRKAVTYTARRRSNSKTRRITIIVFAVAALILIAFNAIKNIKDKAQYLTPSILGASASEEYIYTGKGLLYFSGNNLIYNDFKDKELDYSYPANSDAIKVGASEDIACVYSGNNIQILGAYGQSISVAQDIKSAKCSSKYVAALTENAIYIYNNRAELIETIDLTNVTLLSYGFSDGVFYTLFLDTTSSLPQTKLTTRDLDKQSTTGIMSISAQLVDKLAFSSKSTFAICTNEMIMYNKSQNSVISKTRIYGWKLVDTYMDTTKPKLVFRSEEDEKNGVYNLIRYYTITEAEQAEQVKVNVNLYRVPSGTTDVFVLNDNLYAFAGNDIYILSLSDDKKSHIFKKWKTLTVPVEEVEKVSDNVVIITSGNSLYYIEFK